MEHILATLPDTDPLREDFQTQPDQLRTDLRDPGQPNARLDSVVVKQKTDTKVTNYAELVDVRGLRDPTLDPVLHRHLGTHYVNAAANLNQPGLEDIIETYAGPCPNCSPGAWLRSKPGCTWCWPSCATAADTGASCWPVCCSC